MQQGVPERADPNFVERIESTVLDEVIISNHAREAERGSNKNSLSRSTAYRSDPVRPLQVEQSNHHAGRFPLEADSEGNFTALMAPV
jgi:hypothetical protein